MTDDFTYKEVPTGLPAETALEIASTVTSVVPWIGGPIANVLSGLSVGRRIDRVNEVLRRLTDSLCDFKSEASETYVKTEEFEDLLEATLRQAANERNEEKRRVLCSWLIGAVIDPGERHEEQVRFLRLVDELQPSHMIALRALSRAPAPEEEDGLVGSVIGTLQRRLPELSPDVIEETITQMNDLRITKVTNLHTMMTPRGAADLRHGITPLGQRLISYIER